MRIGYAHADSLFSYPHITAVGECEDPMIAGSDALALPQASRIDEGEGSRGASDPHALPPGEGQAV